MNDTINNVLLPITFSNAQKFLVTLLVEYYEEKKESENEKIQKMCNQQELLEKKINKMNSQICSLKLEKKNLSSKLSSANNMIRILTKATEDIGECKSIMNLNMPEINNLIKDKFLNKRLISSNSTLNNKKVAFMPNNLKTKPINNVREEPKRIKSILKKFEEEKMTKTRFNGKKPQLLMLKEKSDPKSKIPVREIQKNKNIDSKKATKFATKTVQEKASKNNIIHSLNETFTVQKRKR